MALTRRAVPVPEPAAAEAVAATRTLRRDTGWMALTTLAVAGLNFGFTLALTWLLPVHEYSVFAAAQALLLMAVNISSASLPWVIAHAVARTPEGHPRRRDAISFVVFTCFLEAAVLACIALVVAGRFSSPAVMAVLVLDVVVIFATAPAVGYLQGTGAFRRLSLLRVANVVVKLGSGFALVLGGAAAAGALLSYAIGDLPLLLVGTAGLASGLKVRARALLSRRLWLQTTGLGLIQGAVAGLAGLDLVLATLFWHGRPAGPLAGYQVAILCSRVPFFLSSSLAQTAFQKLSAHHDSPATVTKTTLHVALVVFVPVAVLVATLPDALVYRFFPSSYSSIPMLLPWTAASGLLIALINVTTTFFQAEQRYKACLLALLPVLADVGLVYAGFRFAGLLGMAAASVVGLALVLAVLLMAGSRKWRLSRALRPGAAVPGLVALGAVALRPVWIAWVVYAGLVFLGTSYLAFWRDHEQDG